MVIIGKNHSLVCFISLFLLGGCGRTSDSHSGSAQSADFTVPSHLENPPPISPVPLGSLDTIALPGAGDLRGLGLVRLLSEPEAKVYYVVDESDELVFEKPLLLVPPFSLTAFAKKDGKRGPTRSFAYEFAKDIYPEQPVIDISRLVPADTALAPFVTNPPTAKFTANPAAEIISLKLKIDGMSNDWEAMKDSRLRGKDASFDVPAATAHIDLSWLQAAEDADYFYIAIATRQKPRTDVHAIYGLDFGASRITAESFGPGADFSYHVQVEADALKIFERDQDKPLSLSKQSIAVTDEIIEIKISKADLPVLNNITDIALRAFAADSLWGTTVRDRMLPIFLRSQFNLYRSELVLAAQRSLTLDFFVPPTHPDSNYIKSHVDLFHTFVPELEAINQIPLYSLNTIPIFYSASDVHSYAGLNASDRGILSTYGPNSSPIAIAQLLAHELAHFQNATNSKLVSKWLQEGMSEWSAEKLLYRHFPAKAAHRHIKNLRYDSYFDRTNDALDSMPLDEWQKEVQGIGYEKSLMFLNLLAAKLGDAPIRKAFQRAVNQKMDSADFQRFLEKQTGKDLSDLFAFWVFPGSPAAEANPELLYKDHDNDGLLGIDELKLGTDPALFDTDGDGFTDGEEYFRGNTNETNDDPSAFFRLAGAPGTTFNYSFHPFTNTPEQIYDGPQFFFPPYQIAVRSNAEANAGTTVLVHSETLAPITYPTSGILPITPKTSTSFTSNISFISPTGESLSALDFEFDLPRSLASYDIVETSIKDDEEHLHLSIRTSQKPDPYGMYGNYVVTFDAVSWGSFGPATTRIFALTFADGVPYWHTFDSEKETSAKLATGINFTFDGALNAALDKSLLQPWLEKSAELLVCFWTELELDHGAELKDSAGCINYSSPGFTQRAARGASIFANSTHALELATPTADFSSTRATRLLKTGITAIQNFEKFLGRPLLDRAFWPVHVFPLNSNIATGFATSSAGAYLAADASLSPSVFDHFYVEQLARLHVTGILDRQSPVPLWIQEVYVHWLTSSAMYQIYPSRDVHAFIRWRTDQYLCFLAATPACANDFPADIPLAQYTDESIAGGTVKSMMLSQLLDAELGSEVMAKTFSIFMNEAPTTARFKDLLKGFAPAKSSTIDSLWLDWVEGSSNASQDKANMRAAFAEGSGSSALYLFEENKISAGGGNINSYLN